MKINLVGQPYADSSNLYHFMNSGCHDLRYTKLSIATAWAKQSGLMRIENHLLDFRNRGGQVTCVLGISEGGATRQGLHLAHKVCDESYVLHDAGRTFHPKVYLFTGPENWSLFTGSNNLTAGGVFWNYEAALEASGSYEDPQDADLVRQIQDWFDALLGDAEICKPLNLDVIKQLIESPQYRIGDEIRMRSRHVRKRKEEESLFGRSAKGKHRDPLRGAKESDIPAVKEMDLPAFEDEPARPREILVHSWFKKMSRSDAQHPTGINSKATGNLKLAQANHPIDQKRYFRHSFFSDLEWVVAKKTPRGVQEKAAVSFEVLIGTKKLGDYDLVIDHAAYRIAGQGNVPTWLHWGEALGAYLKAQDHTNDYVTIEKFEDGSYRLTISTDPVGEIRDTKELA
ncbi:phospholipase D-like domain-containing protein [Streptomyces antibioticus]|uniref:phospholipase D-like domain-containing protein n=1 Tax=Streptomyces antibioticus TaxID=1890 RepID=UPI0033A5BA1E